MRIEEPTTAEEAAAILAAAAANDAPVRFRGGGTKQGWGAAIPDPAIVVSTRGLDRIVEHNAADLTAVLEAGVPLTEAQEAFAGHGQMLAVDPPHGRLEEAGGGGGLEVRTVDEVVGTGDAGATIGGMVATGDSGPLRHRYGAIRDLLLGMTVALPDGSVARSGGKVIKNVAGYDLAKLFAGSFGTLGLITQVAVRLHPIPVGAVTVTGTTGDAEALQAAVGAVAMAPLELEALDVAWQDGKGMVLARCAGRAAGPRVRRAAAVMAAARVRTQTEESDERLWRRQRDGQRSREGVVCRVSALPSELHRVVRAADRIGASVVGRGGLGLYWLSLLPRSAEEATGAVRELRREMAGAAVTVLDAPRDVREGLEVWGSANGSDAALMRRVRAAFDPTGVCNPGLFVVWR